jgi:16S rRNA (cytidine1402-2'-O)-methyltransferase
MPVKGKLYLIPNTLGESPVNNVIPAYNLELINSINVYIVENVRTARRFLSKSNIRNKIDDLKFFVLNQHTTPEEFVQYLKPLFDGEHIGIISEAGCPAVADPGSEIVKIAHQNDIEVVPLVGPSSIFLALMASGFNGQSFSFNGYLPINQADRNVKIKKDEHRSKSENQTQIYIETPYRNNHLLDSLLSTLSNETKLCIATDITIDTEYIKTKAVKVWRKQKPDLNKRPTIFLFLA